ncbi:protein TraX, partial [gut metagenome]
MLSITSIRLSGSTMKLIALFSMLIDHSAYYLMEHGTLLYEAMRYFGRIAFPVFAFLIAEGFRHTRNRMKYFLQLLSFALISEVPWYLLNGADGTHNVMFTLTLGVLALAAFETMKKDGILCGVVILSITCFAFWSGVDYEWRGILMVVIFYFFGEAYHHSFPTGEKVQLLCTFPLMMHYGIVGAGLACLVIARYDGT